MWRAWCTHSFYFWPYFAGRITVFWLRLQIEKQTYFLLFSFVNFPFAFPTTKVIDVPSCSLRLYTFDTTHEWWLSTKYFLLLKTLACISIQQSIRRHTHSHDSVRGGKGSIQQNGWCWNIGQQITPCWLLSKNSSIGYLFLRSFGTVRERKGDGWIECRRHYNIST